MKLFEIMVKGVIIYGAENWGWREWTEIEQIKMKYVRWTLKLNRSTLWHTIRKDTGIRKIVMDAAARAMKFEEKLSRAKEGTLEKMAWEKTRKDEEDKWYKKDRKASWNGKREFLESSGTSVKEWNDCVRVGWDKKEEIKEKRDDRYKEETDKDVEKSKYAKDLKDILGKGNRIYDSAEVKNSRNGLEILARFRLENETRVNEYWRTEEERRCRVCNEQEETITHVLRDCPVTGKIDLDWGRLLSEDKISICRLNELR